MGVKLLGEIIIHVFIVLHRVMSFGSDCVLREYPDMVHGWTVRGDMRDQAIGNAARAAFNSLKGFLDTHVK